jgi:hypothetical protein
MTERTLDIMNRMTYEYNIYIGDMNRMTELTLDILNRMTEQNRPDIAVTVLFHTVRLFRANISRDIEVEGPILQNIEVEGPTLQNTAYTERTLDNDPKSME